MRTLIKHGLIVDPASHVHSKNNLLVEDGRIQGLTAEEPEADVILDAEGMVVSPGFVDIHMHEDPYDPEEGRLIPSIMTSMLRMGVTTAIGGNCGINTVSPLRYLELMDRDGGPINMGLLAGHTFLREQAGHRDKYSAIRPDEQQRLSRLVKEALEAGCFGVSFGIRYVPGVTRDEMVKTACFCHPDRRLQLFFFPVHHYLNSFFIRFPGYHLIPLCRIASSHLPLPHVLHSQTAAEFQDAEGESQNCQQRYKLSAPHYPSFFSSGRLLGGFGPRN